VSGCTPFVEPLPPLDVTADEHYRHEYESQIDDGCDKASDGYFLVGLVRLLLKLLQTSEAMGQGQGLQQIK